MREKVIAVDSLTRIFKVREREKAGLFSSIKSFFNPRMKTVTAVDDISFSLERGEIRGLIGPNGAGKSTTIKILSGVLYPSSGTVDVLGYVPWRDRKTYVRKIGVLFGQKSQLIWELPALDTFELHREVEVKEKSIRDIVYELFAVLPLRDITITPIPIEEVIKTMYQ